MSDDVRARLAAVSALAKAGDLRPARTEYAWACPESTGDEPCLHPGEEETVRRQAAHSGRVVVRQVTDWQPEATT